jgi:phosphomevalonate kinase
MREMGQLSGVDIEPEQQTKLLDASVSMAGVIGGGVPGGKCPLSFSPLIAF